MFGKILNFLAWTGVYQVPLEILNEGAPLPENLSLTPVKSVDIMEKFTNIVIDGWVSEDGQKVSYLALEESSFYRTKFPQFRSFLKVVDPASMNEYERKSFFINLYNMLTIDAILSLESLPRTPRSVTSFWEKYAYKIGGYTLTLDEIEHGILRGNRPHPTNGKLMFRDGDPRSVLSVVPDHRIHSALNCGASSCPALRAFPRRRLDNYLDASMKKFCTNAVQDLNGSLIINSIFDWFSIDFAPSEKLVLRFLSNCVSDRVMQRSLIAASEGRGRGYLFHYNWDLNDM